MSQYILVFCNDHKYYVTNIKYGRMNIIDTAINVTNSANDFDKNVIYSYDNEHGRVTLNDENSTKLNVIFCCNNDNSDKTMIDDDINANNSMDGKDSDNNISFFCDNDTDHIDININNSMKNNDCNNNISFSCNDKDYSIVLDDVINVNDCRNNTDFDNNVIFSCDNDNNCDTADNDINTNNFMNNNNNMTFSCDSNNANVSATGVVLNDVIFPYDDNNSSIILYDLTNAKTSMNYNNCDNNITFSCDDENIINNVAGANITNTSEYLPSTSEIRIEKETTKHESIHNNSSAINNKNSSESLIDISSVNTFGCREDDLYFQSKIARHLENVHKLEPEVKKFSLLSKDNHIFLILKIL
ncbi:hypothetical protein ACFW04_013253 [Cataglyphis niger]